jgi:hypothetical protein
LLTHAEIANARRGPNQVNDFFYTFFLFESSIFYIFLIIGFSSLSLSPF